MSTTYLEIMMIFLYLTKYKKKEYNRDWKFQFWNIEKARQISQKICHFYYFYFRIRRTIYFYHGFFKFLSIIFINFTDNLRIFNSFIEKNLIIEYYWIKNYGKQFQNQEEIKYIGREEKIKYFFNKLNCCKKNP